MSSETKKECVECVDSQAVDAFAEHQLTERRPWCWKVARVGSWTYGFYVLIAPGAVVIYGDVGEAVFRMAASSEEEVLAWAERCASDRHYVMSKIQNREAFRQFFPGDALAWARDVHSESSDFVGDVRALADGGELHAHAFYMAAQDYGIYGVPSCEDWSASAYWIAHALACFARLHKRAERRGHELEANREGR